MCGLVGGYGRDLDIETGLTMIAHRGPDQTSWTWIDGGLYLGHTRLAVQDLSDASAQPFVRGDVTLTYNGELWQPEHLRQVLGGEFRTTGDTEVVAAALDELGPIEGLRALDGMFALAWSQQGSLFLARDPYGEVPLHYGFTAERQLVYGSEVAAVLALGAVPQTIVWVEPGSVLRCDPDGGVRRTMYIGPHRISPVDVGFEEAAETLRGMLTEGVTNRMRADVPVAVLLSGGLDSSATAAILVEQGYSVRLYTAVRNPRSTDLRFARLVAAHLGQPLTEVEVPSPTRATLTAMVTIIEMPHKAQVEIALGCAALGQRLREDGQVCVLSGEGSDELWASYGMDYHGVQRRGWHRYRYESFTGQHRKNFARTNKIFMRYGIEARLPFLQPALARYALRLPQAVVTGDGRHAKAVLARAVEDLLPEGAAWRSKVAFQTGAGLDVAAREVVSQPVAFYRAEYRRRFREVAA